MKMRFQRMIHAKALVLAVPFLLTGCGGEPAPIDPCKKLEQAIKGKDVADARARASLFIERRKKSIARQYQNPIKFGTPTVTCKPPEEPETAAAPKKTNATENPWAKKKKEKPRQAVCQVVLPYCAVK